MIDTATVHFRRLQCAPIVSACLDRALTAYATTSTSTIIQIDAAKVRSRELGLEIGIGARTESDVVKEMLPLRFSTRPHDGTCLFIGCFPGFVSGLGLSRRLLRTVDDFIGINGDEQFLNLWPPRKEIGVIEFGDIVE